MITRWIRNQELVVYFFLAYAISWIIAIPLALSQQGIIRTLPLWSHYFTAYGPLLAAIIVEGVARGSQRIKNLFSKMAKWNVGAGRCMIGAFSPIAIFAVAAIANYLIKGQALNFILLGQINFLPNLGMWAWLFWIFSSGIGEETGWRGFALPRLQKNWSGLPPIPSTLVEINSDFI